MPPACAGFAPGPLRESHTGGSSVRYSNFKVRLNEAEARFHKALEYKRAIDADVDLGIAT